MLQMGYLRQRATDGDKGRSRQKQAPDLTRCGGCMENTLTGKAPGGWKKDASCIWVRRGDPPDVDGGDELKRRRDETGCKKNATSKLYLGRRNCRRALSRALLSSI